MVLFRDAVAMVDQSPGLHSRIVQTGGRNVYNLFYPPLNSFFRAISSDDGQSGPRPHISLIDELHEHQNPGVVNMLKAGQKGRRQPLSVEITNSGFDRSTVCFDHHAYSDKIVNRLEENDEWFAYVCGLDKGDDPLKDESCWAKANPNLGVSVPLKYLRGEVREAIGMPSKASKVKRLNFCMWVDADNPWIDGALWLACETDFDTIERMNELDVVVGALDLSGTRDFTALTLAGKDEGDEHITTATEFWTPKDTLLDRAREDKKGYEDWVERGFVTATPGNHINYRWVAQRLLELQVEIPAFRKCCFDPYRMKYLQAELDGLNVELELVPHPQGYYKVDDQKVEEHNKKLKVGEKPKPSMWMPHSVELLEQAVLSGNFHFKHNPCLTDNSASAVLVPDSKNNRIFDKRKSRGRIDGIVTTAMAIGFLNDKPPPPKKRKYQILTVGPRAS
jgi:phage terminase large subunit-like protein